MFSEKELEKVLREIILRWEVPGMAVGVVLGGELAYTGCFGVQSLRTGAPVTPKTVFCVQSVSKTLVAAAVMRLVEQGDLDLDAPIVDILPYFELGDRRSSQITIRQALSHTSGMPDLDEFEYVDWMRRPEFDDGAGERFVRSLGSRKLVADPGERFSYSNIAYNVLGDLISKVAGKSFESALRESVLLPAGMRNSTFSPLEVPAERLAVPHLRSPEMRVSPRVAYQRADAPSSFLHTTVGDLCCWAIAALQRKKCTQNCILTASSWDLMWSAVVARANQRPSLYEHMALGWNLGYINGQASVSHGGGGFGSTAFLLILPELDAAAVVLCSEESSAHLQAIRALADGLTGAQPQVGVVSGLVPISRALAEGGIERAEACCAGLQSGDGRHSFDEYDLLDLSLQLYSAQKPELAAEMLRLNGRLFPGNVETFLKLGRLHLLSGESEKARDSLLKALALEPDNADAAELLLMARP